MIRISLYFDGRRLDVNGCGRVRLMINNHSRTALLDTGVKVAPSQWDAPSKKIVRHPQRGNLNAWLGKLLIAAEDRTRELALSGAAKDMSVTDIAQDLKARLWGSGDTGPAHPFREYADKFVATKSGTTARTYRTMLNSLDRYDPKAAARDIGAFTSQWARKLDTWVTAEYSPTTRNTFLTNLAAIFHQAQRDGIIDTDPFADVRRKTVQTRKRSLTRDQFRMLWTAEPEGRQERKALDLFKASFLMIAANPVDISRMTEKSIVNGRIEYDRAKTGKHYSIAVVPELAPVLEPYRKGCKLFAPLTKGSYDSAASYLNAGLRRLAKRLGLPPVTFYWARHSWASFAAELDIPVEVISSALGHSHGSAVTLIYIAIDLRKVDRAHRQVLDYVLGD